MKIVSFKICPFVQRVTATLEAKGMDYEVEYISLDRPPEWFIESSPSKQVPILITDLGKVLFESDAIIEYLDEVAEPLQIELTPEQRAINRAWSYQASQNYLVQCSAMQSANANMLNERSEQLTKVFDRVERVLDDRPYFQNETVGNVDIAWSVLLYRSAIIKAHSGFDFLEKHPKCQRWQAQLLTNDWVKNSVSDDFLAPFSNFYLSDQTYLGRGEDCLPSDRKKSDCCG